MLSCFIILCCMFHSITTNSVLLPNFAGRHMLSLTSFMYESDDAISMIIFLVKEDALCTLWMK